ncbi:hypothetical protein [uncultured Lactobacillus sp.]|jgi:hypothetical protein|uniref:hypothetical protein n=1 Tax=uncultured Lactobacillus sp. TaxID=153152 RepID=UPI002804C10B|nr:hypothetical protein [uncultured Lactobacillus sp.]
MGVRFYFDNGLEQLVPGAKLKEISNKIPDKPKHEDVWIQYGEDLMINTSHVVEIIRDDSEAN